MEMEPLILVCILIKVLNLNLMAELQGRGRVLRSLRCLGSQNLLGIS
jgi:hypothetical protein